MTTPARCKSPISNPPGVGNSSLRRRAAKDGRTPTPGLFPPRRVLSCENSTRRHARSTTGAGSITNGTSPTAASADGSMPNFADAPGDLSVDGRNWTTAKDYAELHDVVRDDHRAYHRPLRRRDLEFPWSVVQRARTSASVLANRLERTAEVLRLHGGRHSPSVRGSGVRLRPSVRRRVGAGRHLRRQNIGSASSWPTARRQAKQGALPRNAAYADRGSTANDPSV